MECWDPSTSLDNDCMCADGFERDEDTMMCMLVPEVDPMPMDGETEADTESSNGSVLKFAVMIFALCLSYLI